MTVNYLKEQSTHLQVKLIISPDKDKLATLGRALKHLGNQPGIIFCNFKDSIQRISDYLFDMGIEHGCFYGGLEQRDREEALVMFRNGTHQLLLATDLAARGIDVPEIKFILHYHLPQRKEEFIHRNGRTARMNTNGSAYVLKWTHETLPDFIRTKEIEELNESDIPKRPIWSTIRISGGRRDKISKGDIVGLCFKIGGLEKDQLGVIELKQDYAFIGVKEAVAEDLRQKIDRQRLKKTKIKAYII